MKSTKCILLIFCLSFVFSPLLSAQDSFEDELESELEAELDASEDALSSTEDSSFGEESSGEDVSDTDFSEEDLDQAFSDEGSNGEDMDFSDFDDTEFGGEGEESLGAVPVESENLNETTDKLDLEPLSEEPAIEEPVTETPSGPPIMDTLQPEPQEDMVQQAPEPLSPMAESSSGDVGPNLEYEARLYNIYVNYHNSPTPEGEWLSMVGARQSELYRIQQGDTLWGISETFFGDGQFWPKIWSVNDKIQNPHLISRGNQIQFVMGTESDAPMFTVSETQTQETDEKNVEMDLDIQTINELIESGALDAADAEQFKKSVETNETPSEVKAETAGEKSFPEPDIEIPPPSVVSRPVLKQLPPSVPEWQNTSFIGDYDDLGISYSRRPIADLKDEIYLSSYIDDQELISDAEVIEIETGSRIAWELQYIYVKFPIGKGVPGEKYLVVENLGELGRPNDFIDSSDLGYQKVISGMVTIGEKVKADVDEKKYDVYRAFVNKAINPIKLGGELVRGQLPVINLDDKGPRSDIVSQIIGGSLDKRRSVFGKASVVFLNRGIEDGLTEGQVLSIRANRFVRNGDSKVLENQRVIGTLKVVKSANRFATAVITESNEDILAGDYTGEGRLLPRMVKEQLNKSMAPSSGGTADDFGKDAFADGGGDDELEKLLDEGESDLDSGFDETDDSFDDFEGESDFEL